MKEAWQTFKELWAIKRLRSTIVLCLWLVFIGFIVVGLRNSNTTTNINSLEYKNYNNYEVVYKIGDIEIQGTTYNNESYLYIDGKSYVYMNDELSYNGEIIPQTFNNISLNLLQPKNLDNLINQGIYDSKVTYTDSVKYNYIVSSDVYNNHMNSFLVNENVLISVTKENNLVTKIEFNNISISYSNINKIQGFNK